MLAFGRLQAFFHDLNDHFISNNFTFLQRLLCLSQQIINTALSKQKISFLDPVKNVSSRINKILLLKFPSNSSKTDSKAEVKRELFNPSCYCVPSVARVSSLLPQNPASFHQKKSLHCDWLIFFYVHVMLAFDLSIPDLSRGEGGVSGRITVGWSVK